jgi:hypothetical protein
LVSVYLVAFLADEDEEGVPEEEKMTFHAQANVGVRVPPYDLANMQLTEFSFKDESLPLIVHPVLMKYLLKFDITSTPGP